MKLPMLVFSVCTLLLASPVKATDLAKQDEGKLRVMVIDSGISEIPEFQPFLSKVNAQQDLLDLVGHGSHVTGIILYGPTIFGKVCDSVRIYSCKVFYPNVHSTANCFKAAKKYKIHIVNFSGGGPDFIKEEADAIADFKGKVIASAGNSEDNKGPIDLSKKRFYPASLPNVVAIGNGTSEKKRAPSSNYGLPNMKWRDGNGVVSYGPMKGHFVMMSGTSQAAAIYTHELVQKYCQHFK